MNNRSFPYWISALLAVVLVSGCSGHSRKMHAGYDSLVSFADSITNTPMKSGRFGLASGFFEKLTALKEKEGADSARSVLLGFFGRLHPSVRITDSLAVLQLVEWMRNCFTSMDSGGVFFTNGDADTYAAWYLQQVEGIRPDLIVISLPFLMGPDYRRTLKNNMRIRSALNLSEKDSLPIPPSTGQTQDVLVEMITRQISRPEHPPLYFAPRCGIERKFSGHIVDLDLIETYQDPVQPRNRILDHLISKLTRGWELRYASKGMPQDQSYAARVASIQYLTLLIRLVPEFEEQKRYQDIETLYAYLEPVVGEDWRFQLLRYKSCHQPEEKCQEYLTRLKQYAARHPDDPRVQEALRGLEKK
ncbi:MAG: hypothetical protein WCE90_06375 [Candidatus Zixiibacteriota bacterium]